MFVNHLCEAKGEQDGEANKAQECFGEFVIPSSDSPVALDALGRSFLPDDDGTVVVRFVRPGMQV